MDLSSASETALYSRVMYSMLVAPRQSRRGRRIYFRSFCEGFACIVVRVENRNDAATACLDRLRCIHAEDRYEIPVVGHSAQTTIPSTLTGAGAGLLVAVKKLVKLCNF